MKTLADLPPEILVEDVTQYSRDWWALSMLRRRRGEVLPRPRMAVRPRSTEEVSQVLAIAASDGVPVIPFGAGSSVCGGVSGNADALILDLRSMDKILETDEQSMVISAQAGISGPRLEGALTAVGLTMGHFPQSFHISTLGGWISTKASGQLSTKYGAIEDRVIGLTAVLADGTTLRTRPVPRRAAGPDWMQLFLGAEGVLGVVTEATLSALKLSTNHRWLSFSFVDFSQGVEFLRLVIQSGVKPSVARLYDDTDTSMNFADIGISGCVAIVRLEGQETVVAAEAAIVEGIGRQLSVVPAQPEIGEYWWEHRFDAVDNYRKIMETEILGPHALVDTFDVSALWSKIPEVYEAVAASLKRKSDGVAAHISHLYSSGANIYFTFLVTNAADDAEAERRYNQIWEDAIASCIGAGGSISHHHGIGLLKAPWMPDELSTGFKALRRIKSSFDPDNAMNPGKLGLPGR